MSGAPFNRFPDMCLFAVSFMYTERFISDLQCNSLMKLAPCDIKQPRIERDKVKQGRVRECTTCKGRDNRDTGHWEMCRVS